jgi:hypothetical protein
MRSPSRPRTWLVASQRAVGAALGVAARASARERGAGVRLAGLPKMAVMAWARAQGWQSRPGPRLPS